MTKADMDAETLAALNASFAKWEKNARVRKPEDAELSYSDCPLCALFHSWECQGCPVAVSSGNVLCGGTPYWEAYFLYDYWRFDGKAANNFRAAAREEAAFLKSLLPEAEQ